MNSPARGNTAVIDAIAHPSVRRGDELRDYMQEPWRSRTFPPPQRYLYPAPTGIPPYGEYREDARPAAGLAGSDPKLYEQFMVSHGIDRAVLLPLTRGLLPDVDLNTVICAATNDWLAATWLSQNNEAGRYFGSIRVNPDDPEAAVAEIERCAGHSRMVQVGIPMESHQPYGQRRYFKIWEAAARYSLPVALSTDGGAGVNLKPTALGFPRHYIEYSSMHQLNFVYHLASLVAEGVFDRLPGAKFVFTDGGHDLLMPLIWRMDMDWMFSRSEIPWVKHMPSKYLREHVRFCTSRFEGPRLAPMVPAWLEISDIADLLLFGSHYPHWASAAPEETLGGLQDPGVRSSVLGGNAAKWYCFDRSADRAK